MKFENLLVITGSIFFLVLIYLLSKGDADQRRIGLEKYRSCMLILRNHEACNK